MEEEQPGESVLIGHGECRYVDECGSSDAAAEYSNGWVHCFACGKNWKKDGSASSVGSVQRKTKLEEKMIVRGDVKSLSKRSISEDVAKRYRYQVGKVPRDYPVSDDSALGKMKGKTVQIENYYDADGSLVGQKLRDKDKNFAVVGNISKALFGRHCVPAGGKLLVVTEGAIDCMSYAVARNNWPAVSIPNGADSGAASIKANLEYLESFEKVVFIFDNDEGGRKGVEKAKGLLSPGKMAVGFLPEEYNDINEALEAGDIKAIMSAVFNAETVEPDGLVDIDDILDEAMKPVEWGLPWFFPELTKATYGRRYGECYALGAGTGVGKTDVFTEQVAFDIFTLKEQVGLFFLEQKPVETAKRVAGKVGNRRFHVPDDGWTKEELVESIMALKGHVTFYDSFGQTEWEKVRNRIRHLRHAKGIRLFYLDHLTALADTKDEKGSLEQIMKEIAGLADELGIIIHFISHLATPEGTPHEEGGRVKIRHFKGSRSIGFWSYFMFGLERDQQAEDEDERQQTTFRILKDRYTGQSTGLTFTLGYDAETGRIIPPHGADMPSHIKDEEF